MISPGELWLVDFGEPYPSEPAYTRPAVVLGPVARFSDRFPYRFVVPLTTTAHGFNLHIEIEPGPHNRLSHVSYAQTEMLRSVAASRLVKPLGVAGLAELISVRSAIANLLGLSAV